MSVSAPTAVWRALGLLAVSGAAWAQTATVAEPSPAPAPTVAKPQQIEINGARQSDTDERRRSTAAKIVVGREEIERFGDASVGDLLKRLPGVTVDGRSGRGGAIRMRGLGSGYTQILLDGERVQGGLSLDSLDPEQIERIEILRAPTAETGARAIAGTINIVTREGFRKRLNDLKFGLGGERDHGGGSVNWSRDDQLGEDLSYSLSVSTWAWRWADEGRTDTVSPSLDMSELSEGTGRQRGAHLNGRLQWRLGEGESLTLMPLLRVALGDSRRDSTLQVREAGASERPDWVASGTDGDSRSRLARLNGQWRQLLPGGVRAEWKAGLGESVNDGHSAREERAADGTPTRRQDDDSRATERTVNLSAKLSRVLDNGHELVGGLEFDAARRLDERTQLQDGSPLLAEFGSQLQARSRRLAAYGQDEWTINPRWSAHAGLRWEGIRVQGQGLDTDTPENVSSVWTPLLHAVWKPDPATRDQVRLSLTRSYRSPGLSQLLARPSLSSRYPLPGENTATSPDRAGNPALRPELATGIDLAFERYLPEGGLLSANLFHRRIHDLMRTVTTLETVSWSAVPRWVARPTNLGDATTEGLELEAKAALSAFWPEGPRVDLRANASVFRSTVDGVPGPDNRLDQQPGGTLNLGADWKPRGTPLTLGANLNWTPGYTTRLSETQWLVLARKQSLDAYLLWQITPWARLRLSGANLLPDESWSTSQVDAEAATTRAQTYVHWRAQLELKL